MINDSIRPTMAAPPDMLGTKLARPLDKTQLGNDVAALNNLCAFLNNPLVTGADAPAPTAKGKPLAPELPMEDSSGATIVVSDPVLAQGVAAAIPAPLPQMDFSRLYFTGRIAVGKDYLATTVGSRIVSFAEPLYYLARHFFGVEVTSEKGKELPGVREFLQSVGQWGRGTVSAKYPLTPARAAFITMIRSLGAAGALDNNLGVTWADFGLSPNLWLDAALVRLKVSDDTAPRVAITNCRFGNEFKRLSELGWVNWHVMTTPGEWAARLLKRGLKPDAPALKDDSEQLAAGLDQQVVQTISRSKNGPKLRVIWNSSTPPPSPRLWTVSEFMRAGGAAKIQSTEDVVLTGE